jgi:hypothetical protein
MPRRQAKCHADRESPLKACRHCDLFEFTPFACQCNPFCGGRLEKSLRPEEEILFAKVAGRRDHG